MNLVDLPIRVARHPLLRPAAFTTHFPEPLGSLPPPGGRADGRQRCPCREVPLRQSML
jgi:hypothetical protein